MNFDMHMGLPEKTFLVDNLAMSTLLLIKCIFINNSDKLGHYGLSLRMNY